MKNLVPINKFDTEFIKQLRGANVDDIRSIVPELLEWMQDGNWPTSEYIMEYFSPRINEVKDEIIKILLGDDEMWKYWILLGLIYHSPTRPNDEILSTVKYLRDNATIQEKEAGIDILSIEILE